MFTFSVNWHLLRTRTLNARHGRRPALLESGDSEATSPRQQAAAVDPRSCLLSSALVVAGLYVFRRIGFWVAKGVELNTFFTLRTRVDRDVFWRKIAYVVVFLSAVRSLGFVQHMITAHCS